ncbi:uncharacterized protein ACA1_215930 [Acanthamoeba castellanii str. Neff]|uniref:Uncharacterized protein n=1 Tax=Acanthamoeba castellanii (strain ATCC 30010 / Neff) TaxID=1257118 RepID=L8GSN5_ACACF|nr:uncharacterized protein ACA1_215930 [Acanthamoeba castellanii str. Neff]ELR15111.1 hypothetical protein ACA1_215930 [Acanthamoeba castellanii str. Neff]
MKRRRHEVVDLSLLPPIETLIPDELKNYTKEELSAYLESKGIQPKVTKPEMKRQMRLVLQAVKENKPELIVQLQNDALREIIETPRKLSRPVDFPRPHLPAGLQIPMAAAAAAAAVQEGDVAMCSGPGCRKKANRECDFLRCRSCCTRNGYLCYIHMNDVQRRGNESHLYREHPFVKGTAEVSASGLSTSQASRTTSTVGAQAQPAEPTQRGPTESVKERMVWMETCPGCGVPVAAAGSLFLLHLRLCCPDILERLLAEPHNARAMLRRPHAVESEEEADDTGLPDAPEEEDVEEELEPVDKAKVRAELRYKRRKADLGLLFSNEPPLLEAIGDTILNFAERKASLQRIVEKLEGLVGDDASLVALDAEQRRIDSFAGYLDALDAAATIDEVAGLEQAFEAEHGIILHAGNVAFNVHRHQRAAASTADDHGLPPLAPQQPRSAVAPETVYLAQL